MPDIEVVECIVKSLASNVATARLVWDALLDFERSADVNINQFHYIEMKCNGKYLTFDGDNDVTVSIYGKLLRKFEVSNKEDAGKVAEFVLRGKDDD